jgi:hypothetical protein
MIFKWAVLKTIYVGFNVERRRKKKKIEFLCGTQIRHALDYVSSRRIIYASQDILVGNDKI